jgi:hypothetical protein
LPWNPLAYYPAARDQVVVSTGELRDFGMGNEATCTVRFGKQKARGKALLETSELIFRSEDGALRLKISFSDIKSTKAVAGELHLETPEGLAVFNLGANATKWCEKILHPKTRLEKLGVKSDVVVSVLGDFDTDFLAELSATTKNIADSRLIEGSEWIFFAAQAAKDLDRVSKLAKNIRGSAALWVVYPKGQKHITENDVLAAGRKAGLKDVKVVGFSPTHTALKFVLPLTSR